MNIKHKSKMARGLLLFGYLFSSKDYQKVLDSIVKFYADNGHKCTLVSTLPPKPSKSPQYPGGKWYYCSDKNAPDVWKQYHKDDKIYREAYNKYHANKDYFNTKIVGTPLTLHVFMYKKLHLFLCWGDNFKIQDGRNNKTTLTELPVVDFNNISIPEFLEVIEAVEGKSVTIEDLKYRSIIRN